MGFLLQALDRLLPDPPPPLVFEIGDGSLVGARRAGPTVQACAERTLPDPGREDADGGAGDSLRAALEEILREIEPLPSARAAVLLPDSETRLAVFDFDRLPRRGSDLRRSVRERFSNSLPFKARVAYRIQLGTGRPSVLATAAPASYVRLCESAFESAGILPGHVGLSTEAALNLLEPDRMTLLVKRGGAVLTMAAADGGAVRLVRRIAVASADAADPGSALRELLPDLFPTLVYIEENLGQSVSKVLATGFGDALGPVVESLRSELQCEVGGLLDRETADPALPAGLLGFMRV